MAKKDWELSHLQSLREEENKVAEEDAIDEIPLTYDRPDISNKVTLRRSSTGMWKVCSSGQNSDNFNHTAGIMGNQSSRKMNCDDRKKYLKSGDSEIKEFNSNKRYLRSSKSYSVAQADTTTTLGNHNYYDPGVRHQRARSKHKDVMVNRFSSRANNSLEVIKGSLSGINDAECNNEFGRNCTACDRKPSEVSIAPSNDNFSCTSDDHSMLNLSRELVTRNDSSVNHKYPTRLKAIGHS